MATQDQTDQTDQPAGMWSYWSREKGIEEALADYYPAALAADPKLRSALTAIEAHRLLIDSIMKAREEAADEA